ncbi:MAG: hypothetical protein Q9213_007161 [Squamulea squamosa]
MSVEKDDGMNVAISAKHTSSSIEIENTVVDGFNRGNHSGNYTAIDGPPHLGAANSPNSVQTSRGRNDMNGSIDRSQQNDKPASSHLSLVYHLFRRLQGIIHDGSVKINGEDLDISTVVAVSRHATYPNLDERPQFTARVADSVALLDKLLGEGETIYGVNTGFGGSADTRSNQNQDLQSALLQHHQFGVLTANDKGSSEASGDLLASHAMPESWARGTMLVRCNSLIRGHSAVSLHIIQTIMAFLRNKMTPIIPLRGSISASGDLSPLSYVAGMVTGNPDIYVRTPSGIRKACQALQQLDVDPITLGPKEGLGLMNGTAVSTAAGSLALYETHHISVLSQVLTAMTLEALAGAAEGFDSFIAEVRPHRGQIETAKNIQEFLRGSHLARGLAHNDDSPQIPGMLYQDRYALRTAAQWIGPLLEDILLAHEQVTTELNSTTDNPLVDVAGQKIYHGGNFQAVSITLAMEKLRLSLQMFGRLLFAQCSELINPMLNNGLPPNLAADEPSTSFAMKGVDIGMASYMSELAFLANPVSSHVQTAEMHNQAVNSLALISARYTLHAVEIVSLMIASHLYTVCQALDLRVRQMSYFQALEPLVHSVNKKAFHHLLPDAEFGALHQRIWEYIQTVWLQTTTKDSVHRCTLVIDSTLEVIVKFFISSAKSTNSSAFEALSTWRDLAIDCLAETYTTTRDQFFRSQNTANYLGNGTRKLFVYVRETLGVPFHQGLCDHPSPDNNEKKLTIGSWISVIYEALRDGRLHGPVMEGLVEAQASYNRQ